MAGYIFDYGGTLDTGGQHWGQVLWHAYERHHVPVSEAQFREAYVHAERMLGSQHIIQPDFTFRQTLEAKLRLQLEYLGNLSPLTSHLCLTISIPEPLIRHIRAVRFYCNSKIRACRWHW